MEIRTIELKEGEAISIESLGLTVRVLATIQGIETYLSPGRFGMEHAIKIDDRTSARCVGSLRVITKSSK